MSATAKVLSRGYLTTSSATLYTVPAATTSIVTNVVLSNTGSASVSVSLGLDGVNLIPAVELAINTAIVIDLRQVLTSSATITGFATTSSVVACHISGSEVT